MSLPASTHRHRLLVNTYPIPLLKSFIDLGVRADLCQGLTELGIETPTPVQLQAIPFLIEKEQDLIAQAQTGTGKTAAFGLPLLMKTDPAFPKIQGLVIAPTRELAKQIGKQLFRFTKFSTKVFVEVLSGGDPIDRQVAALQRPTHIIVVTPGRLLDLLKRRALTLEHVKYLILDEADEMLSMGFRKELQEIFSHIKQRRATWLFSATIPPAIEQLTREHMAKNAPVLKIDRAHVVNRQISHQCMIVGNEDKMQVLVDFLNKHHDERGIIFCRTRVSAMKVADQLKKHDFTLELLHGDIMQKDRDKVMRSFKKERVRLLVATDVAARGIDVADLSFVIHHQLPEQMESYTHRSGRTARAGKAGRSLALVHPKEKHKLKELEEHLGIHFSELR